MKPLRHPRAWLALWWLAIVLTVVVCLVPAPDLPHAPGGDKFQHFVAYFLLAASAVQLYSGRRTLLRVGIGLVALGIAIEFAQAAFTATRAMEAWDVVADALGVLAGLATSLTPLRDVLLRIDGRRA